MTTMELNSSAIVLSSLAIAIYLAIVIIAWRNARLSAPWKQIFALSALPVFILGMVANVWLSANYAPWLFEILGWAKEAGGLGAESRVGFVIAVPLALLTTMLWYLFLRSLDRATKTQELKFGA